MSLKTREKNSLSLTRIFHRMHTQHVQDINVDLQLATGETHSDGGIDYFCLCSACTQNLDAPNKIMKSQSESYAARAPLSFHAMQCQKINQQIEGVLLNRRIRYQQQPASTDTAPSAYARITAASLKTKAQLTIFYAGMVNVFDDVPEDKAHAIMLLATSNASSVSCINASAALASEPVVTTTTTPAASTTASVKRDFKCGVPAAFMSPSASSFSELKQPPIGRPHTELPFARKASLARFLERRKDRLQVKKGAGNRDIEALDRRHVCAELDVRPPKRICPSS